MFELLQFSLMDMTPYSRQSYFDLIAYYQQAVWPAHLVALVMALGLLWNLFRSPRGESGNLVILGIAWLWIGGVFHLQFYADLNWAAVPLAYLFMFQGVILLAAASLVKPSDGWISRKRSVWLAGGLLFLAVLVYPLMGFMEGRSVVQLECFAITPAPTLIATLAVLLLMKGWLKYALVLIPMLWALLSFSFAWTLHLLEAYIIALVVLIWWLVQVVDWLKWKKYKQM